MTGNFDYRRIFITFLTVVSLLIVLLTSSTSLAQEEKRGFLDRIFGNQQERPIALNDKTNIAWLGELPAGLSDGDYTKCVPVSGSEILDLNSAVTTHFNQSIKVSGAAAFVRRLSEEGDVSGEFFVEQFMWSSSIGKVSELGTNMTARTSSNSSSTTSDVRFEVTEISGEDTEICLTELEVYGTIEEEEGVPSPKIGIEGNWLVEYSDAGKAPGTGATYGYGVKGETVYGSLTVWPTEDAATTGNWNITSCTMKDGHTGCEGKLFNYSPEGKVNFQHGGGFMGLWGGTSHVKQVGPDEVRGRWTYQDKYGGTEVWRRVRPEITKVVLSSLVTDDFDPAQRPGRVEMTYSGWGETNFARAVRPKFYMSIYGKNLWGRNNIRVEPVFKDTELIYSDLEYRCCGLIKDASSDQPSNVIGTGMEVIAWAGAVPGRKTLYIDDVAVPFDFIVPGHPMEREVIWPDDATKSEDLQKITLKIVGADGNSLDKITDNTPFRIKLDYKEDPKTAPVSTELNWTSQSPEFPSGEKNIPLSPTAPDSKTYQSALYFLASLSSRDSREVRGFSGNSPASTAIAAELFSGRWSINHNGGKIGNDQGVTVVSDDGENVSLSIGKKNYQSFEIMATRDSVNGRHTLDVRFDEKDKDGSADAPSETETTPLVPSDASGVSLMQPSTGSERLIPELPDAPIGSAQPLPETSPELDYQVIYIADDTGAIMATTAENSVEIAVELSDGPPDRYRINLMAREAGGELSGSWSEELTNGNLASEGQQIWRRENIRLKGVLMLDDQLDATGGYNYPYTLEGEKIEHLQDERTLVVYGNGLPKFADGVVIKSLSDKISYQTDFRDSSDRDNVIEKAFEKAGINKDNQYDAFIVKASLSEGSEPGIKTLSVNDENLSWPLLFANQIALMRFVRDKTMPTSVFYPGDIGYISLSFAADLPLDEIGISISRGSENTVDDGVLLARLMDDDDPVFRNYVTEPIHFYHRSNTALSPPEDINALRIPVLEGAVINARLVDPAKALTLPQEVHATIYDNPDQLGTLWKEALDRVAVCYSETIDDYDKYQQQEATRISNFIMAEGKSRNTPIRKGEHAAAILIRDEFVKLTLGVLPSFDKSARNIENIRIYRQNAQQSAAIANNPFWNAFEATYEEEGWLWDSETKIPLADTLDEDAMASKFNISPAAAKKWAEEQTLEAAIKQIDLMQRAISRAQDAGNCNLDEMMLIAGHNSPIIVGQILPRLVKQQTDAGPPERKYWIDDKPAQSFVLGLHQTGATIRALEAYSVADTNVGLAIAALATVGTTAAVKALGSAQAYLWTSLVVDAAEMTFGALGVEKYAQAENYYEFARGAAPILGETILNEASANRQSATMTAVGLLLPTATGAMSVSQLRHFKNVQHGKSLFANADILDNLSTLRDTDRIGLAGYYSDLLTKVRKTGIDKLDDADRAAFDSFQNYFKGEGMTPPSIAQVGQDVIEGASTTASPSSSAANLDDTITLLPRSGSAANLDETITLPPPSGSAPNPIIKKWYDPLADQVLDPNLGVSALAKQKALEEAEELYQRLNPAQQGRASEALEIFERLLRNNPEFSNIDEALAARMIMLHAAGDLPTAAGLSSAIEAEDLVARVAAWNRVDVPADELAEAANISTLNAEAALSRGNGWANRFEASPNTTNVTPNPEAVKSSSGSVEDLNNTRPPPNDTIPPNGAQPLNNSPQVTFENALARQRRVAAGDLANQVPGAQLRMQELGDAQRMLNSGDPAELEIAQRIQKSLMDLGVPEFDALKRTALHYRRSGTYGQKLNEAHILAEGIALKGTRTVTAAEIAAATGVSRTAAIVAIENTIEKLGNNTGLLKIE